MRQATMGLLLAAMGCDSEATLARKLVGDWTIERVEVQTSVYATAAGGEPLKHSFVHETTGSWVFSADYTGLMGVAESTAEDGDQQSTLGALERQFVWEPSGGDEFTLAIDEQFVFEIWDVNQLGGNTAELSFFDQVTYAGIEESVTQVHFLVRDK